MRQSGFRFDGDSVGDQVPACGQAVQAGLKQAWLGYTTAKKITDGRAASSNASGASPRTSTLTRRPRH
ncbi:precorrin-6Y C(5,15)-methyltransferase [Mycobacterium tuberculosis variant africanum]|nr:precorrin-6Y C(5,15)-methyltransferase [Mycobacterium tuberculosis variant africanum]